MAMVGYKKIIENMVELEVENYIEKRTEKNVFAYPVSGTLELSVEDKSFGHPTFKVEFMVKYRKYEVHGYVNDLGSVIISSISFDRDYVKDQERLDWYADENVIHKHFFLYGEKMDQFKFDT